MKKKKILFISLIVFICTIITIPYLIVSSLLNKINIKPNNIHSSNPVVLPNSATAPKTVHSNKIINILFLGIDNENNESGRSDCIMIFSIDEGHNKIKLSSIARDSYVTINSSGIKDKINHAYSYGGPNLSIETINNNFNLDISNYVCVNFSTFPKLIDSIGGLELTITEDEIKFINGYIDSINKINNTNSCHITKPGKTKVDGTQALAYSRIRYTKGGDFERTHRQRIVINEIIKKISNLPPHKCYLLLNNTLPLIETNLSKYEIISYGTSLLSLNNYEVIEKRFPCDEDSSDKLINGIYYYVFNENNTTKKIHNFIYE